MLKKKEEQNRAPSNHQGLSQCDSTKNSANKGPRIKTENASSVEHAEESGTTSAEPVEHLSRASTGCNERLPSYKEFVKTAISTKRLPTYAESIISEDLGRQLPTYAEALAIRKISTPSSGAKASAIGKIPPTARDGRMGVGGDVSTQGDRASPAVEVVYPVLESKGLLHRAGNVVINAFSRDTSQPLTQQEDFMYLMGQVRGEHARILSFRGFDRALLLHIKFGCPTLTYCHYRACCMNIQYE